VRGLWDLVVALRGTVTVASRRSSRARVVALGLVASLALGGHLAVSRIGDGSEPDLAAPRDRADAADDEAGPAGGGPLAASLTASGDGGSSPTGAEAGGGPGGNAPAARAPLPTAAAGPAGDDGLRATAPGEAASTTTTPARSTTTPPPTDPSDGSVTTTTPPGGGSDDDSAGLVGGLLDLLGLSG
jgi:hypothetical protein